MKAWKLFEEYGDQPHTLPRTLVHGLPMDDGRRSRVLELETWYNMEEDTPGFNLFKTRDAAIKYLPRFTVRAKRLVLCQVVVNELYTNKKSAYHFAESIMIRQRLWLQREKGADLLPTPPLHNPLPD